MYLFLKLYAISIFCYRQIICRSLNNLCSKFYAVISICSKDISIFVRQCAKKSNFRKIEFKFFTCIRRCNILTCFTKTLHLRKTLSHRVFNITERFLLSKNKNVKFSHFLPFSGHLLPLIECIYSTLVLSNYLLTRPRHHHAPTAG